MTLPDPKIEHGPGFAKYSWDNVLIRLDHLRSHGEHLSAELAIDIDSTYFYGADRLSLTNGESRAKIAKRLTAMRNKVDWNAMLDWAAQATLDQQRLGEPFLEVGSMRLRQDPLWLLEPLLPLGHPTILFGEGGIGKSTVAELLGLCVQMGWGKSLSLAVPRPGPVLYLDWESDAQEINDNLKEFEAGLDLPERPRFIYRFCTQPLIDMVETVREEVYRHKVALVIVDSAVPACGGAREARENAEPLFQALREFKTTSLIISHEVKDQLQKKRTPYGDVFFSNRARMVWHLRGDPEAEGNRLELSLSNVKVNYMPRQKPWGLRITRNELGNIGAERFDLAESEILSQYLPVISRIQITLSRGSMTAVDLAESTNIALPTVKTKLSQGKKRGLFQMLEGKPPLWGLAAKTWS